MGFGVFGVVAQPDARLRVAVVVEATGDLDEAEASKAMAEKLLETALDYGER